MAYRFSHKDESVQHAVRRITRQQVHAVIAMIDDPAADREATVHELRKASKKLRALLRLVRPVLQDARKEIVVLRDLARHVSAVRDAATLVGSFDRVMAAYGTQVDRDVQDAIRKRLVLQRDELMAATDVPALLADCRAVLLALEWRSCEWTLDADGAGALRRGLRKSYRKARDAMSDAVAAPTPERLHAWRKREKDHWYHARLLAPIWEKPMGAYVDAANALGDLLGDHHDLTVLLDALARQPHRFGSDEDAEVLAGLTRSLQAVLEAKAFADGARLFAESPSALADSWCTRYAAWRRDVPTHATALHRVADATRYASAPAQDVRST